MAFCDDPAHAWIRGHLGRQAADPRVPTSREDLVTLTDAGTRPRTATSGGTVRLTTAQALVRWMLAQRSELLDGTEVPLFAGVFGDLRARQRARPGHGAVRGPGRAPDLARPDRGGHGARRRRRTPRRPTAAR